MNKIVLPIRQEGWNLVGADDVLLLGGIWADEEGKAEAAKIVTAVNCHASLVAALEKIASYAKYQSNFNEDILRVATEALKLAKDG